MNSSNQDTLFPDRPREINVTEFVQQRALEISNLMAVIDNKDLPSGEVAQGPRTFIQRQPRHMRRRAMSYNTKRLPRQRRQMAKEYIGEHKHRKKPPCRFYRRKPCNLLKAYTNRQRNAKWLESHIWHAKRFHMVDKYGWKLPDRSCQRGFRASYRDTVRHCTVEDLSYYSCLELSGAQEMLIEGFRQMCPASVGLSFKSIMFLDGQVEGWTVLYEPGRYPYGCIGQVSFMWKPLGSNLDQKRILWIWVHPSLETELISCLVKLFTLEKQSAELQSELQSEIFGNSNINVKLQNLKGSLLRFRLTGPKSTSILNETLIQPRLASIKLDLSENQPTAWNSWTSYYSKLEPGRIKPGQIISLVVEDPRIKLDYKKTIPPDTEFITTRLPPIVSNLAESPIWSHAVRNAVCKTKMKENDLNMKRSEVSLLQLKQFDHSILEGNLIPVLLCQQPADRGYGSGWDVILPAGWGMPFWMAFQFRTARAAGLQVHEQIAVEIGRFQFPALWPDTTSGKDYAISIAKKLEEKYLLRPFNRRIQYSNLKIKYPFCSPLLELVSGWHDDGCQDFYVLRNRKLLNTLKRILAEHNQLDDQFWRENQISNAIVPVRLISINKGIPRAHSIICLPTEEDIQTISNLAFREKPSNQNLEKLISPSDEKEYRSGDLQEDFLSFDSGLGPEIDLDKFFVDKVEQKLNKRKLKEKQRQKRKKQGLTHSQTQNLNDLQSKSNVVFSCSRRIIGFVSCGDYSFSIGKGVGLGFCSALALKEYLKLPPLKDQQKKNKNTVLFRNTNSKLYRACSLEIVV